MSLYNYNVDDSLILFGQFWLVAPTGATISGCTKGVENECRQI